MAATVIAGLIVLAVMAPGLVAAWLHAERDKARARARQARIERWLAEHNYGAMRQYPE